MRWSAGKIFAALSWIPRVLSPILTLVSKAVDAFARVFALASRGLASLSQEFRRLSGESNKVAADMRRAIPDQQSKRPLDPQKKTIFLLITCGQAARNFLVSDVLDGLRARFNVAILSPYADSEDFHARYGRQGVHLLPWFESFRTVSERLFQYYLMKQSGSRTHESWMENLEERASGGGGFRYFKHRSLQRASNALGAVLGPVRMHALYASYYHAFLDRGMFDRLFEAYQPAAVISTTAQHAEAWPLTYEAKRRGVTSIANILSWDNPTTKPTMDLSCPWYTVWSEEMSREMRQCFPYIEMTPVVVGAPMFDLYYNKPHALDRETFLSRLGLPARLPYILWTTNTPAGMPHEHMIVREFWKRMQETEWAGRCNLVIRLHPKESDAKYLDLKDLPGVALTYAGDPFWAKSDHWLPGEEDMELLLNSMMHAAVSVNIASTMSLESFALGLPTINVAFKPEGYEEDHGLLWKFEMYHQSDHYRALVENGAVEIVRSQPELVAATLDALRDGATRQDAMRRTLEQKAGYLDGRSSARFCAVIEDIVLNDGRNLSRIDNRSDARDAAPVSPASEAAE
jgi:hypothetical protein